MTSQEALQRPNRKWRRKMGVVAATGCLAIGGLNFAAPPANAQYSNCADVVGIGVPGTNEGQAHHPGKIDNDSIYGPKVADMIEAAAQTLPSFEAHAINYRATGLGGVGNWNAAAAKLAYNASEYKVSKDEGYNLAYQTLASYAASCKKSTKFILFGYSQGAHIAGDLTNSIFNGNGPIGSDRLAASALLADPAFNRVIKEAGVTGRSALYQYNGPSPTSSDFDPSDDTVFSTVGRGWDVRGSLGKRQAYPAGAPVLSACIVGDPVCDLNSVGLGGINAKEAAEKSWYHGLYTDVNFQDTSATLATFVGKAAAGMAKG